MNDSCDAKNLLREKNLRMTRQRVVLLEGVLRFKGPFNALNLHQAFTKKKRLDIATVYRGLNIFNENGIIREVQSASSSANGTQFYELACVHHPVHPHFFCRKCEKIICLGPIGFKDSLHISRWAGSFETEDISIEIRGLCSRCK